METLYGIMHPENGIVVNQGIHNYYKTEEEALNKAKKLIKNGWDGPLKVYKLELIEVVS